MSRPRSAARKNWPEGLYQNSSGYFYWRDPVAKKAYGLGYDRPSAFAEARAANAKQAAAKSMTLLERMDASECPSLADWVSEWLTRSAEKLAPKTIKNHRSAMRELVTRCGTMRVDQITPKMIADVLELYADTNRGRMAELIRSTASEVFRAAEVRGHIKVGANPVAPTKTKAVAVKRVRLSLEDFMAIHAAQRKPWAKRAMELALITAQRRGDVAEMQRSDVADGHLLVDQRKSGGITKLGIPLSLGLKATGWTIESALAKCRSAGLISRTYVHHQTSGAHWQAGDSVDVDTISEAFAKARERAGLVIPEGREPPTFHEIRSLAIRLYTEEYGKEFAQTLAGHKDMKTTLLYSDPRDSEAKRIMVPDPSRRQVSNEF